MTETRFVKIMTGSNNGLDVRMLDSVSNGINGSVSVEGNVVTVDSEVVDPMKFAEKLYDVMLLFREVFPEVPLWDAIFDYGVASIELIDRIEHLQQVGIAVTIVDIFEHNTPCAIAAHCAFRDVQREL